MLPVAEYLAAEFPQHPAVTGRRLNALIAAALPSGPDPERIDSTRNALLHLGYLWRSPTSRYWEPGIPSLMTYVHAHEESSQ